MIDYFIGGVIPCRDVTESGKVPQGEPVYPSHDIPNESHEFEFYDPWTRVSNQAPPCTPSPVNSLVYMSLSEELSSWWAYLDEHDLTKFRDNWVRIMLPYRDAP